MVTKSCETCVRRDFCAENIKYSCFDGNFFNWIPAHKRTTNREYLKSIDPIDAMLILIYKHAELEGEIENLKVKDDKIQALTKKYGVQTSVKAFANCAMRDWLDEECT